jgi:hypothetical protein
MSQTTNGPDDLSEMSRAELEAEVRDLQERVAQLEQQKPNEAGVSMLLQTLLGLDKDPTMSLGHADLEDAAKDLQETLTMLESTVEKMTTEAGRKKDKVRKILDFAQNKRNGQAVVKVSPQDIKGATGVSRRYAYQLTHPEDGLPGEYPWCLAPREMDQYGSLEIDRDGGDERVMGVDFEGVHKSPAPVNKFITRTSQQGGSE